MKKLQKKKEERKRILVTWQPNLRKTPRGGRMMATMISMHVAVPIFDLLERERKTDNLVYRTVLLGTIKPKDNVKR